MKVWMRTLTVTFTSKALKKSMTFGNNYKEDKPDLNIDVQGYKYMSTLKDACTIRISNLTYNEIVQLIQGQFYDVEVKAGYRSIGEFTIFKGGVLYISNSLGDRKTNTAIILCASDLVAKYGQSRLNLTLNSGINLYSAINFICKRAGVPNTNISTQFKKQFLKDIANVNNTAGSWIDNLCNNNQNYITNTDGGTNSSFSIYDASKSNSRILKLNSNNVEIVGGSPQLTNDGLTFSLMPTLNLMCGDVIQIDNSIISIAVESQEEVKKNYGYYLDKEGMYTIYQIKYNLQNRGSNFSYNIVAKSRSLISNITGGK